MSNETQVAQETVIPQVSEQVQSNVQQTTLTETPTNTDWRASLPEDIRTEKSLETIKDISSLAKSYIHAQKLVGSDKIPIPNKHATEYDWNVVYEKLGRPKSAAEYKLAIPQGMAVNEESLNVFKNTSHKLGLLPKQAEGMVAFYNEMQSATNAEQDKIAAQARTEATNNLKKEWGQAFNQKLNQASQVANKYLDAGFASLTLSDGTKLGDHPSFIKAFASIASEMGEDQLVSTVGNNFLTPAEINKQISELQKEGSAYWNKSHPNHAAAVQEVKDLLELKHASV